MFLHVQTFSDAILTFSENPDGSGSNFEIHLGVNGFDSCIYENQIQLDCYQNSISLNPNRLERIYMSWVDGNAYVFHDIPVIYRRLSNSFPVRFFGVKTR